MNSEMFKVTLRCDYRGYKKNDVFYGHITREINDSFWLSGPIGMYRLDYTIVNIERGEMKRLPGTLIPVWVPSNLVNESTPELPTLNHRKISSIFIMEVEGQ